MAATTPDPSITVMQDGDGTYVLAVAGVATRHRGLASLWSAIDALDAAVDQRDGAAV